MIFERIKAYNIGLVFKNGKCVRLLREGLYVKPLDAEIVVYDMRKPFLINDLNILLRNDELREALIIDHVLDNEIALRFDDGLYKQVLGPGKYAFWKEYTITTLVKADISKIAITEPIDRSLFTKADLAPYIRAFSVEPNESALLYVDGKLDRVLEAGSYHFWKNSIPVHLQRIDKRTQQMELAGQEILTQDKAGIRINFFARYQVTDILKALTENKEYDKQLYTLMQLVSREYIGKLTLDELLGKRNDIASEIQAVIAPQVASLGVSLLEFGVKDIILPGDLRNIMNQVLIAEKNAQANIIMRREETASTRSLLNTAKLMEENQMLFKLKEMEYVEKIADKINSISLSGGNDLAAQLKQIFVPR